MQPTPSIYTWEVRLSVEAWPPLDGLFLIDMRDPVPCGCTAPEQFGLDCIKKSNRASHGKEANENHSSIVPANTAWTPSLTFLSEGL